MSSNFIINSNKFYRPSTGTTDIRVLPLMVTLVKITGSVYNMTHKHFAIALVELDAEKRTIRNGYLRNNMKTGLIIVRSRRLVLFFIILLVSCSRSQWPRGLRRRTEAARLLRLWVRIPPGAWMFVYGEFCVLSGKGLCDGLITRP